MYIPFGTWPTPKMWSRWNGVLTLCTKAILAKSWLRAKRFRFLVVPSTSTTLDPERFRQEGSTSILLRSCDKLARERKSPGGLTRNHVTSLIQRGTLRRFSEVTHLRLSEMTHSHENREA